MKLVARYVGLLVAIAVLMVAGCSNPAERQWNQLVRSGQEALARGDNELATKITEKQLELAREKFGADNLKVAMSLQNLGACYEGSGNLDEAERLFTQSIGIYDSHPGKLEKQLALALYRLGDIRLQLGQPSQAELPLKRCSEIRKRLLGESDPLVDVTLIPLAQAMTELGQAQDALEVLDEAYSINSIHPGVGYANLISTWRSYGKAYSRLGLTDNAEAAYRKGIEVWRSSGQDSPYHIGTLFFELGAIEEKSGQFDEAVKLYNEAILAHSHSDHGDARVSVALYLALASAYTQMRELAMADSALSAITLIYREYLDDNPDVWSTIEYRKALVQERSGKMAEAEESLLSSIRLAREGYGGSSVAVASRLNKLSHMYDEDRQPAKARESAVEATIAATAVAKQLGTQVSDYFDWAESLVRKAGDLDKAAELASRADSIQVEVGPDSTK
jgi:tetratricopeptide (TPR) repeat protein